MLLREELLFVRVARTWPWRCRSLFVSPGTAQSSELRFLSFLKQKERFLLNPLLTTGPRSAIFDLHSSISTTVTVLTQDFEPFPGRICLASMRNWDGECMSS